MGDQDWKPLDTSELLRRQREQHVQTTSAGVGGYEVPIGAPLRPPVPPYQTVKPSKKPRRK